MTESAARPPRNSPAELTPQQRELRSKGAFATYCELVVGGGAGPLALVSYELYNLLVAPLPGALGLAIRTLALPLLLKRSGKSPAVGRSVGIRQPSNISLGRKAIIDDYAVLDVRSRNRDASIDIGDECFIGRFTTIAAKEGHISLGTACNVSSHCRIATQSKVEIGKSVLIAAYVYIGPGNHQRDEDGKPLIEEAMEIKGGVTIGDKAWIGTRATILDGVTIGEGAVVGAHSLVTSDVPANTIVAGIPAKPI